MSEMHATCCLRASYPLIHVHVVQLWMLLSFAGAVAAVLLFLFCITGGAEEWMVIAAVACVGFTVGTYMCMCMCVCMYVYVYVYVHVHVHVHAHAMIAHDRAQ